MNVKVKVKELLRYYDFNEMFLTSAIVAILDHRKEFEEYFKNTQKLQFVKSLKDYSGGGLKECKEVADLYWEGKILNPLKEERRIKLEQLAKAPLVNQLLEKIKKLDNDSLFSFLMNLDIDELLSMDELLSE